MIRSCMKLFDNLFRPFPIEWSWYNQLLCSRGLHKIYMIKLKINIRITYIKQCIDNFGVITKSFPFIAVCPY